MDDAKERLIGPRVCRLAPFRPAVGARQRLLVVGIIERRGAFVQDHCYVWPQRLFNLHDPFRREIVLATVNMAAKGDAVIVQLALMGQAENLKAARIGQDGAVPAHKAVETAKLLHQFMAGAQIEMIGIGQDQLRTSLGEIARFEGLDIGQRADRGKGRHLNRAVGRVQGT